jgi:transposase
MRFIDETRATTNMARTRGRCPRGQRLRAAVPHGHWKTSTFVAALRNDGITAPFVIDGAISGRRRPSPTATSSSWTTSGSHKVAGVREAIEARGVRLVYLPAYSPDFNPIEQVFAKLKELLRAAAARTVDTLWSAIGQLLDRFPPQECANLANCGYRQST